MARRHPDRIPATSFPKALRRSMKSSVRMVPGAISVDRRQLRFAVSDNEKVVGPDGAGSPPVWAINLHGFFAGGGMYWRESARLAETLGWRIITPSLPGFGGSDPLEWGHVSMADLAEQITAIADVADVALDFSSPVGTVVVSAVPGGVEQILDNLIDNAITAAPPGTHVSVTVVRGRSDHQFTIVDEGPGLNDDLKARALDRFWRSDHSEPGTGLGLPIANALAKASGGSLVLDDSPAGGLAVSVTLPATGSKP